MEVKEAQAGNARNEAQAGNAHNSEQKAALCPRPAGGDHGPGRDGSGGRVADGGDGGHGEAQREAPNARHKGTLLDVSYPDPQSTNPVGSHPLAV
jgi:hypothetical protein